MNVMELLIAGLVPLVGVLIGFWLFQPQKPRESKWTVKHPYTTKHRGDEDPLDG